MGDRLRSQSSSGLRFLLRLLSVVAALFVLCLSSRASAAAMAAVPMCGERNESVAAPPIFRAFDSSTISALPCQGPLELGADQSLPTAPERVVVCERPERVLGFGALRITQSQALRLPVERADAPLVLPGFVETLFRPPRG